MSLQIRYADKKEERVRRFLLPVRIVKTFGDVTNEQALLDEVPTQSYLGDFKGCVLNGKSAGVLLDFGSEIHGCVRINLNLVNESVKYTPVHIRMGESVSEALAEIGWKNAGNDHALRDGHVILSALSTHDTNESGFRFAYVALDGDDKVELLSIQAIMIARDIPYIGKFECSDMLVNEIWETAAHTVHMCMQDYLWDGIKRDRLVWMGDMHTEILTSLYVFGETDTVSKSLDFLRDRTPDGCWMNNMPTYSLWWVIVQFDLYMRTGNFEYLTEQKEYLTALSNRLKKLVKENGEEDMPGRKFLDWPTSEMPVASHEGIQGLLKLALDAAAYMLAELGEEELSKELNEKAVLMKKHIPEASGNKGAGAILTLSGIADAAKMNAERFAGGGAKGYSSLMGGYILNARAEAGDTEGALKDMREFWGGMLSMGATTFWEDFDVDWLENAARIDEIVPEGKKDIHADFGAYCYQGLRHSLCHGWSSGPVVFLTEYVLGVMPMDPGYNTVRIRGDLGDLEYANGSVPTPKGILHVFHRKGSDGKIATRVEAPEGIEVILD